MTKTLQEFLGYTAEAYDGNLYIYLPELLRIIGLNDMDLPLEDDGVGIVSLLLRALLETTTPPTNPNGFPVDDPDQGIVSDIRNASSRVVTRGSTTQIKYTLKFNLYSQDLTNFVPNRIIGAKRPNTSPSMPPPSSSN